MPSKIKCLTDKRQRKSIPFENALIIVWVCFMLQYESFNEIFTYQTTRQRIKNLVRGHIPKTDAARAILKTVNTVELKKIHESVVAKIKKTKINQKTGIDGYQVAAIDGVELFSSEKKHCEKCLSRKHSNGTVEWFHRSVVCATIGSDPHLVLGEEMLTPRDGSEKDEGELTGGKRLIQELYKKHHHFADVIVADALYLNAPFIKTVQSCHMNVVIRLKNEKRQIFKDAEALFKSEGKQQGFEKDNVKVQVWDLNGFEMAHLSGPFRVLKFEETWPTKPYQRKMWLVTDLEEATAQTLWRMMHSRWDIENNVFHQLKTYYHANHCYEHEATETIFLLELLAFNLREMYFYQRLHHFRKTKQTRREATQKLRDSLLINDCRECLDSS